jgi:predicted outer membrane repeat protein
LYVGGSANPEPGVVALAGAFSWLDANAASNTAYAIVLYQDAAMPARTLAYSGKTNVDITIKGDTAGRSIQLSGTGSLFTINTGVRLIVEALTLQGRGNASETSNTASLVRVNGGALEMRQDSFVTGNYNNSSNSSTLYGGGVYVALSGTFTMQGNASISDNTARYGGAVYVDSSGTFIMQDTASVSGNTAVSYGAGV